MHFHYSHHQTLVTLYVIKKRMQQYGGLGVQSLKIQNKHRLTDAIYLRCSMVHLVASIRAF